MGKTVIVETYVKEMYECNGCGRRFEQYGQQPVWRVGETSVMKCARCHEECVLTKVAERLERWDE